VSLFRLGRLSQNFYLSTRMSISYDFSRVKNSNSKEILQNLIWKRGSKKCWVLE